MQTNVAEALGKMSAELSQVSNELSMIQVKDPDLLALRAQGVLLSQMLARAEFAQAIINDEQIQHLSHLVDEYRDIAAQAINELSRSQE